jgi:hypothetical protein
MRTSPRLLLALSVTATLVAGVNACDSGTFANPLTVYDPDAGPATGFTLDSSTPGEASTDAAGNGGDASKAEAGAAAEAGADAGGSVDGASRGDGGDAGSSDASAGGDADQADDANEPG